MSKEGEAIISQGSSSQDFTTIAPKVFLYLVLHSVFFFSEIQAIPFLRLSRIWGPVPLNIHGQTTESAQLHTVYAMRVDQESVLQHVLTSEILCCMSTFTQAFSVKQITHYLSPSWNESKLATVFRKKNKCSTRSHRPVCLLIIHCVDSLSMSKCLKSIITIRAYPLGVHWHSWRHPQRQNCFFSVFFSPLCCLGAT